MSNTRYYYDLHCCVCGGFVKPGADSEGPYGKATDIDPPPDEYYCERCAKAKKLDYISGGRIWRWAYRESKWQTEANEFLAQLEGNLVARMEARK